MLEMSSDRLNRLPAGGAKESEVSVGNVQMESANKSLQRIGNMSVNQALWYRRHA
jgi:hypothetical protein